MAWVWSERAVAAVFEDVFGRRHLQEMRHSPAQDAEGDAERITGLHDIIHFRPAQLLDDAARLKTLCQVISSELFES
jgi:hypothetical protein